MPKKGGGCGLGGVCRHTKNAKTAKTVKAAKTVNGLDGRVASPVFLGPMSAVIAAGKKPPKPPKPSNATHPLDHTPPLQHLEYEGHPPELKIKVVMSKVVFKSLPKLEVLRESFLTIYTAIHSQILPLLLQVWMAGESQAELKGTN